MKLSEIANLLGAGTAGLNGREPIGYSIDSRTVREGELFFAVRGEIHDGHRFVPSALAEGAVAAVVTEEFARSQPEEVRARLLAVPDTLAALQTLASSVLRGWVGREVAVTGSAGKTTTKELTAAVLGEVGAVMKTAGNFNNAYGLPLSILKMESNGAHASDYDFAVLEMGMNHAGEIAELTRIAPPDLGIVTNVGAVHLEFFPSVDAIADAKAELVLGVKPGGAAVLNADDHRVARMDSLRLDLHVRMYGIEADADVMARNIQPEGVSGTRFTLVTPGGSVEARLPLAGRHNLYNALAAAAAADFYGVALDKIAAALGRAAGAKMRGEVWRFAEGVTVIDDSYNSNPRALVEMVTTMCADEGCRRRIVVAGEMLELGAAGPELHREAGRSIAGLGVDLLIAVRGLAREIVEGAREAGLPAGATFFYDTPEEAAEMIEREMREGDLILVKGSRGVKTEKVVERLKNRMGDKGRNHG